MISKMKWFAGVALAGGLVVGSLVASGVSAQSATPSVSPGPGYGMMGGGFGPHAVMGGDGTDVEHDAIANALSLTSQELWEARAAGTSVADLAQDKNVDLSKIVDTALAAHTVHLDAAIKAGTLTQVQADAMQALMKSHIESHFQTTTGVGASDTGMMGGRGMMDGSGFGRHGRDAQ